MSHFHKKREARFARLREILDAGGTLQAAAAEMGVKPNTLRRQMERAGMRTLLARVGAPRPYRVLPEDIRAARRLVQEQADAGHGLRQSAAALGLSGPGLLYWLRRNEEHELAAQIRDNGGQGSRLTLDEIRRRVRGVRACGYRLPEAAERLGVSYHALRQWFSRQVNGRGMAGGVTRDDIVQVCEDWLDDEDETGDIAA